MRYIFIVLLIPIFSFSNIFNKNFEAHITEKGKNYIKTYNLSYKKNKIVVEILSPELNKGEIYVYENGKKTIYYPIIKKTVEQKFSSSDNDLMLLLEDIKNISNKGYKNDIVKIDNYKTFLFKNGLVVKIKTANADIIIDYDEKSRPTRILVNVANEILEYEWSY